MKLVYGINDKPGFGKLIVYAIQQLLAIMAATLVVPIIVGHDMQPAAALFGAGVGTLVYVLFTKAKSPVFLGSSFAFLGSMAAAFAGAVSMQKGYAGLLIGAILAGLVYVIISIIVKACGVAWIDVLMPKQVIGPTVAIIGLSLAGNAIGDLQTAGYKVTQIVQNPVIENGVAKIVESEVQVQTASVLLCVLTGLITLFVTMACSVFGKKTLKLIPFIIGILAGYVFAAIMTLIGDAAGIPELMITNFSVFENMSVFEVPKFTFIEGIKGFSEVDGQYILSLVAAYVPVAFVVFAEHLADHKNISSIIEKDLLTEPGLHRTLLGDGVGSMAGAFFGGCPNTTYGESIACVAITGNASVYTIITAAILAMLISFFSPFVALVNSIPSCVMGGVCMALYGFIAVSGLKMIQKVDLEDNANLFTVSVILIAGIGGLVLNFGAVSLTEVATALILGIFVNVLFGKKNEKTEETEKKRK